MMTVYSGRGLPHMYCMHKSQMKPSTQRLPELLFFHGLSARLTQTGCLTLRREPVGQSMQKRPISSDLPLLRGRHEPRNEQVGKIRLHRIKAAGHDDASDGSGPAA